MVVSKSLLGWMNVITMNVGAWVQHGCSVGAARVQRRYSVTVAGPRALVVHHCSE